MTCAIDWKKERRRIRDRNRSFERMADASKRVAIAKDVLKWLDAGALNPSTGTYLGTTLGLGHSSDVRDDLAVRGQACTVCAIGATFYAAAMRHGDISADEVRDGSSFAMRKYLEKWFPLKQVCLIECAFERSGSFIAHLPGGHQEDEEVRRAVDLGYSHRDHSDRMRAIMQNIIANRGDFKP